MAHEVVPSSQGWRPVWHICWQTAVGREFFPVPSFRRRIRDRVVDAHNAPGRTLIDYCLMPHEIHVVSQLDAGQEPGELARVIGNLVARWVREVRPIRSPVLAGPYRAYRIASEAELLHNIRLLAWRPVVLGLCRTPSYYKDGAVGVAVGRRPVDGFNPFPLLYRFGTTINDARPALRKFLSQRPDEFEFRSWELMRGLTLAVSGVGPQPLMAHEVRDAAAAILIAAGKDGVDGALRLLVRWVAARLGGHGIDVQGGRDATAARARALVARISIEHALCSAASVARFFGRSKATLSEQVARSRLRESDGEIVSAPAPRIVAEVAELDAMGEGLVHRTFEAKGGPPRTGNTAH